MDKDPSPTQKRKVGRAPSKKARTSPDAPKHAPAMPSTQRALELELELRATQKGITKADLQELTLIEYLCKRGRSLRFIHDEVNYLRETNKINPMCYGSFLKLRDRFPDYFRPMNDWMSHADDQVESSLFESAIGQTIYEERAIVVSDGKDVGSHVEIKRLRKQLPANTNAATFWLENRRPDKWRKKVDAIREAFANMSDDELLALVEEELHNKRKDTKHKEPNPPEE